MKLFEILLDVIIMTLVKIILFVTFPCYFPLARNYGNAVEYNLTEIKVIGCQYVTHPSNDP